MRTILAASAAAALVAGVAGTAAAQCSYMGMAKMTPVPETEPVETAEAPTPAPATPVILPDAETVTETDEG